MPNWKKIITSGSNAKLSTLLVDGAVTAPNFIGTASYVLPRGSVGNVIFNNADDYTGSLDFIYNKTDRTVAVKNVAAINAITASGNLNSYIQLNVQNMNNSTQASSDIVATNNTGDETGNFIDMGINGSGYTQTSVVGYSNDAYLYNTGSKLIIGNATSAFHVSSSIWFFAGGTDAKSNLRMVISSSGYVGVNVERPRYHMEVGGTVSSSVYIGNGSQLTNVTSSFTTMTFTRGITLSDTVSGIGQNDYYIWLAPYPCRVTDLYVRANRAQAVVNAFKSGSSGLVPHVSSNVSVSIINYWTKAGSVQNTDYAAGDSLQIGVTGSALTTQIAVQVNFIRI